MKRKLLMTLLTLTLALCSILGLTACGHEHSYTTSVTAPTCTEQGYTTYTCSCGDSYVDAYVDELGHEYGAYISNGDGTHTKTCANDNSHIITQDCSGGTATCLDKATCTVCKQKYGKTSSCSYDGKICRWCGNGAYSKGLEYSLDFYGLGYTVTGKGSCSDTNIVIPSTYQGLSVTSIGEDAFEYCTSLASVVIPDSVKSIGESAFEDCTSLASIVIPDSVTSIGSSAFYNCTSLTSVVIGDSVTSIGEWAFGWCTSLTSVVIGDSVTSIGSRAFSDCTSLTSIEIPNSVTSIGDDAFEGCTSLTFNIKNKLAYLGNSENAYLYLSHITASDITTSILDKDCRFIGYSAFNGGSSLTSIEIPHSVTSIGERAFYHCPSLTSIEIPNSVTSIGERAFSDCDSLTSVIIGDSVTSIGSFAFGDCTSLTSVVIGDSVTSIGVGAFSGCDSLASIIIPDSVTSIGGYVFEFCTSLTSVYYSGTKEDWDNISIESSNSNLTETTLYYYIENESDLPNDNGKYWHYVDGVPTIWN